MTFLFLNISVLQKKKTFLYSYFHTSINNLSCNAGRDVLVFKTLYYNLTMLNYDFVNRCIYSNKKLNNDQMKSLQTLEEDITFTCGSQFFPEEHSLYNVSAISIFNNQAPP